MELKDCHFTPGDGIGPEIVGEAVKVLDRVAAKYGHVFKYEKALVGACAIDATGDPYPAETHAVCVRVPNAASFGAIGDPEVRQRTRRPRYGPSRGLRPGCASRSDCTPTCARWPCSTRWPAARR